MHVSECILDGSILLQKPMMMNYHIGKTPFMPLGCRNAAYVQRLFDHFNGLTVQDLIYLLHQEFDPVHYDHGPPADPSNWRLYVKTYHTDTQPATWKRVPNHYEVLRIPEYILEHGLLVLSIYPEYDNAHNIIISGEVTPEYLTQIIHNECRTAIEYHKNRLDEEINHQRHEVEEMRNGGIFITSEQSSRNTKILQKLANRYENSKTEAMHATHGVVF